MFRNFTLSSSVNKDLSFSVMWINHPYKKIVFSKCLWIVALLSASSLFHLNFLATDDRCNSTEYFSNKSTQNFSALTKSVLTSVYGLSLHMPKKQSYWSEHPPNKMEGDFYKLFYSSWLNMCFFAVGKSKLQIIIYQTVSPQTKPITTVMHQISLNLSCPCKLKKTLWLQHSSCHFLQHNLFCNSSDLYHYSLLKASLNFISWKKPKTETCLKTGLWWGVFSYGNLTLLECLEVSITEIMSFAFLKSKKLLFLFNSLFCLYKSRQFRSENRCFPCLSSFLHNDTFQLWYLIINSKISGD